MADLSIISKRSFGTLAGFITISERHEDRFTVTKHPVQVGAQISDHIYAETPTLNCEYRFAPTNGAPVSVIYNKILQLANSFEPFSVVTGKRAYDNMLITNIGVTTETKTENILAVHIEFQQVFITNTLTVSVTRNARNKKKIAPPTNSGQKQAAPAQPEKSALGQLFEVFK